MLTPVNRARVPLKARKPSSPTRTFMLPAQQTGDSDGERHGLSHGLLQALRMLHQSGTGGQRFRGPNQDRLEALMM
jgi:hypothetical protein